jgi:hypothetical protein
MAERLQQEAVAAFVVAQLVQDCVLKFMAHASWRTTERVSKLDP